jgi:hypothetical protein
MDGTVFIILDLAGRSPNELNPAKPHRGRTSPLRTSRTAWRILAAVPTPVPSLVPICRMLKPRARSWALCRGQRSAWGDAKIKEQGRPRLRAAPL